MLKAHLAWGSIDKIDNPEGWLFRIAHNAALDFIRRRLRMPELLTEEELTMTAGPVAPDPDLAEMSIRTFLRLPLFSAVPSSLKMSSDTRLKRYLLKSV